ncbi:MAG: Gfo/Idh/MocA family protein, partial [Planctomycetota bacterium]
MTGQELRIGFIGSGYIAGVHAAGLQRIEGVRLAACMDVDGERAAEFAAWTGCAPHADIEPVLEASDAVWVCSPPTFHREQVVACLQAGRHVYCEKPLAGTLDDGRAIVAAAQSADVLAAIGFNFHFCKAWRKCKEILDSGELGEPVMFVAQRLDGPPGPGWRLERELMVGMNI